MQMCTALVFEFFPMNLYEVRERYGPLSILDIKLYIWQLFRGQAHLEKVLFFNSLYGKIQRNLRNVNRFQKKFVISYCRTMSVTEI